MKPDHAKGMRPFTWIMPGLFFLYLALMSGDVSGNGLLMLLIGIGLLLVGVCLSDGIRQVLLSRMGIKEIDLDEQAKHEVYERKDDDV